MHSTTNVFNDTTTQEFDPKKLPDDLRQLLITTVNPREIYADHVYESSRRLRLLYRRFLNQITYGCTNVYCDTPPCLSYRKRIAAGPVRPYREVAARALAAKCVEQYASRGRDLGRYSKQDKGKGKQNDDGLCHNEPVVPWYTDPVEYLERKQAVVERDMRVHRARTVLTRPLSHPEHKQNSQALDPLPATESPDNHITVKKMSEKSYTEREGHPGTDATGQSIVTSESYLNELRNSAPSDINRRPVSTLTDPDRGPVPDNRLDPAAFAQYLFSTTHLRTLSKPLDATEPEPPVLSNGHESQQNEAKQYSSQRTDMQGNTPSPTSAGSSCTLKLLPVSAVVWLRELYTKQEGQRARNTCREAPSTRLDSFVQQCLFFVFTDARRLLLSASTWDGYHRFSPTSPITTSTAKVIKFAQIAENAAFPSWNSVREVCADLVHFACNDGGHSCLVNHVMQALQQGFNLPTDSKLLYVVNRPEHSESVILSNDELARLIMLTINIATTTRNQSPALDNLCKSRQALFSHGVSHSPSSEDWTIYRPNAEPPTCDMYRGHEDHPGSRYPISQIPQGMIWLHDHDVARLYRTISNLVSHRLSADAMTRTRRDAEKGTRPSISIIQTIVRLLQKLRMTKDFSSTAGDASIELLDSMHAIMAETWDGMPVVRRASPVGGALEMFRGLYQSRQKLGLDEECFESKCVVDALDETEMPYGWLNFKPDVTKLHILQFPYLIPPVILVRYFRSLNLKMMKLSHEKAMGVYANSKAQLLHAQAQWALNGIEDVLAKTRPHMACYFTMSVRRDNIVEDAIGQIWHRERQELLRPLRVRLGQENGEEGMDHGGVQQEFFRLVFAEAFQPQYGMFQIDDATRMTWFHPQSMEPLYKYEALGLLMSLAIFNGVTIPMTMPVAFYRKILGLKVKKTEHIIDGWPMLAKSLQQLLEWEDGDVGDVMCRTYEFSYDAFGSRVDVDMTQPVMLFSQPSKESNGTRNISGALGGGLDFNGELNNDETPPTSTKVSARHVDSSPASHDQPIDTETTSIEEPPLVTNANRHAYVKDYINYLTNKTIAPQFTAFLRGLHVLLSPQALSLFPPATLKLVFEGLPANQPLDINAWRSITEYETFEPTDNVIIWFWEVLRDDFTQIQLRKLLEFVTASDRIPVTGWRGVIFKVQKNGDDDVMLPSSSTCYGMLLLPEYSTKEVLRSKLSTAIEYSSGFGNL